MSIPPHTKKNKKSRPPRAHLPVLYALYVVKEACIKAIDHAVALSVLENGGGDPLNLFCATPRARRFCYTVISDAI